MAAAPLTLEVAHAIDAPFEIFDDWFDVLVYGCCTACGRDAYEGRTGWWHETSRTCRNPDGLRPTFAPDS